MSENTKIEWATHTFNPWEGCQKVGPGCDNCYAEARNARFAGGTAINWGPGAPRRRTSAANWHKPIAWNANHEAFFKEHGYRQRVFCASLSDVFDNAVDPQWLVDLFALIERTPNLDWLLLTKRIGNVLKMVQDGKFFPAHWPNVWIGATIVNQEEADRDIPKLLAVPAAKRFLSMEPLLGPVSFEGMFASGSPADGTNMLEELDWVIVGGESGPNARPMHPHWARSLRDQCVAAGVPFFFKQWGEWVPRSACYHTFEDGKALSDIDPSNRLFPCIRLTEAGHNGNRLAHSGEGDHAYMSKTGKKKAGRLLDGRTWDEVPS